MAGRAEVGAWKAEASTGEVKGGGDSGGAAPAGGRRRRGGR